MHHKRGRGACIIVLHERMKIKEHIQSKRIYLKCSSLKSGWRGFCIPLCLSRISLKWWKIRLKIFALLQKNILYSTILIFYNNSFSIHIFFLYTCLALVILKKRDLILFWEVVVFKNNSVNLWIIRESSSFATNIMPCNV